MQSESWGYVEDIIGAVRLERIQNFRGDLGEEAGEGS